MRLWITFVALLCSACAQNPAPPDVASKYSPEAIAEIKAKAEAGDPKAQVVLGQAYEEGNGVPQNDDAAMKWYRKAAEQGNAEAQNDLGVMYRMGRGVQEDKAEAVRWYLKSAKQGYASAYFNVGAAYYNGDGVTADMMRACAWFVAAQEAGSDSGRDAAQRTLSEMPKDLTVECHFFAGRLLESGDEAKPDPVKAVSEYRMAGDAGNAVALWRLAALADRGAGLPKDGAEATRLRNKALALDHGPVMVDYGNMLRTGNGVQQDVHAAFEMYRKAAEQYHYAPAMLNVGIMYAEGVGCNKDVNRGYSWIYGAFLNSRDETRNSAKRALEILEAKMSPSDVEKARKDFGRKVGGGLIKTKK